MADESRGRASAPGAVRAIALLLTGALVGAGITSGAFLLLDRDSDPDPTEQFAGAIDPPDGFDELDTPGESPGPPIDPTDTAFGELTDEADVVGVRVQWRGELVEGEGAGTTEFVTAHRDAVFVFSIGQTRIVEEAGTVHVCGDGGCAPASVDDAVQSLPPTARPFYRVLRIHIEAAASPEYTITGETELAGGIFQRCGGYDPDVFGLDLPGDTRRVTQCIDVGRNVPLALDLVGPDRSVGTASLLAIADARPEDFAIT